MHNLSSVENADRTMIQQVVNPFVGEVVGTGKVLQIKDNIQVDAIITKIASETFKSQIKYYLYVNGEKKGYINLDHFRLRENNIFSSDDRDSETCYYGYNYCGDVLDNRNDEVKNKSYIYIDHIFNFKKSEYKGIGSLLFQVAIEHSLSLGCEGRIRLAAVRDSHVFHYKQGMRTEYTVTKTAIFGGNDDYIRQEMKDQEAGKPPSKELGRENMYLPQENINIWKGKIVLNAILQ
jgi:hypothetical protein